jgi:hypothetical protein
MCHSIYERRNLLILMAYLYFGRRISGVYMEGPTKKDTKFVNFLSSFVDVQNPFKN